MKQMLILLLILQSCNIRNEFTIDNTKQDTCIILKLGDGKTVSPSTFGLSVVENTLNDTAIIGMKKIPPNWTGNVSKLHDFYEPTKKICYKHYKATSGKIKCRYFY